MPEAGEVGEQRVGVGSLLKGRSTPARGVDGGIQKDREPHLRFCCKGCSAFFGAALNVGLPITAAVSTPVRCRKKSGLTLKMPFRRLRRRAQRGGKKPRLQFPLWWGRGKWTST